MYTAKDIVIKVIDSASSRLVVQKYHYSGKCTQNSQIHFGVFLNDKLEGALQFGPSTDKRKMAGNLGVGFNDFLELNRMALSDNCPKNSESRALGICLRMLRKKYPHLKLVISFADACQCGDGTIYKASGFKLHSFKKNTTLRLMPDGSVVADKTFNNTINRIIKGVHLRDTKPIVGFQMKYLFFFDKELEKKFKFVDFDKIPEGVKMYKGIKRSELENKVPSFHDGESGATPTTALHSLAGEING
ncbi:MAG: hypothetical protein RLZ75_3049 [Pseudomonadota bacterium]|jgi:hypothetical protein